MPPILKSFFSLLLIIPLFHACDDGNDLENCDEHEVEQCQTQADQVNVRIKNVSDYGLCNVKINHGGERVNYGIVEKGETTCYRYTDTGYQFTFVFAKIRGILFQDQAIAYSGQLPLDSGKYTYEVEVLNFEREQLEVEAKKDD